MKLKNIMAMLLAALMVMSLAACGGNGGSETTTAAAGEATTAAAGDETTAAGETTADGLEIGVVGGSEDSMGLNTATVGALNGLSACRHVYEGLYKIGADGEVTLGQAAKAEQSDDGLTWTFTLRDDITWSDGEPVTAEDFIYGFDFLVESADDYSTILSDVADKWEATDDKTVVINTKFACGYLPSILAFPSTYPVRKDMVEEFGESYATEADKAVYNGPFEVVSWEHQAKIVMSKRTDYYDAANIAVGKINWVLTSEESTALNQFKSGDIIYSDVIPDEEVASMVNNGLHYASGMNNYCVMFNLGDNGNDVLKDVRVREALSLAIDRQRIINIRDLNDEMGYSLTCSGFTNADGVDFVDYIDPWFDAEDYEGNCEKAKQLLAEAGYEGGAGFPALNYIVNNDSRKEVAESVVNDWKEVLGIDTITVNKIEGFFAARSGGDFDLAYYGWWMDYTDISNMIGSMVSVQDNNCFWTNEDFLTAYNNAITTEDQKDQWDYYKECEAIMAQDLPVTPILHSQSTFLFDDTNYDGLVYSCGNFVFTYIKAK